jgi:hypothetical protein
MTYNQEKFNDFLFNFSSNQSEVSSILDQIKLAILNKDTEKIENICTFVKTHTDNTNLKNIVNDACDKLYQDVICTSTIIKYTIPIEERELPEENILILNKGVGSCKHAIIYVESEFEDFDDNEIEYLKQLGIREIDIIDTSSDEKIYSGPLVDENDQNKNNDFNEGWLIIIGVIVFIGIGILIAKK